MNNATTNERIKKMIFGAVYPCTLQKLKKREEPKKSKIMLSNG
jgi:hypothetical protein